MILVCANPLLAATNAHTVIRGTIEGNDTPLEFAVVYLHGLERVVYSEEDGNFLLKTSPGKHTLCVQLMGYEKYEKLIEVNPGVNNVGSIELIPNSRNLNEIVVNGKSEKRKIETKGFAVNVVETQKAAIQSIQTNELLDRTAGVRLRQDGGMGSRVNYNINGISGNGVRVFIDGIPSSNYGASFSLNSIPPAIIERIEVYKGVVPGVLSEDALGGAINIVLKNKTTNSITTSYSYGSFNTHQWNLTGNYRNHKGFTLNASAFYNYSDNNYEVWGKDVAFKDSIGNVYKNQRAKRFHDTYESYGGQINVGFTNVKWADRFMIGTNLSESYNEIQTGATMEFVYGDRHARRQGNVFLLSYSKRNLFTKGLSLKLDASHSYLKRQTIDTVGIMYDWQGKIKDIDGNYTVYGNGEKAEAGGDKTVGINTDRTFVLRTNLSYAITDNHIFYFNYLHNNFIRDVSDDLQPLGLQLLANTRDLQKNILSFTYENIAFSNRLRTNIFYKYYFQNVVSNEPKLVDNEYITNHYYKNVDFNGFGATVSFALFPTLHLMGSAEKTIRFPSPEELFGNNSEGIKSALGTLEPEKSNNLNIGLNWDALNLNKHQLKATVSFIYRDTRGMIRVSTPTTGANSFSYFENLENVLTTGFDAELFYNYSDKFDFRFVISKFDALFNVEYNAKGERYNFYRMQIKNEPSFKSNLNVGYHIHNVIFDKSKLSIRYNLNYVNKFRKHWGDIGAANIAYIMPQYPSDIGLVYTFPSKKISFSFDAKNIFNQQLFDNFGLQKPGRAFYGKISYSIL